MIGDGWRVNETLSLRPADPSQADRWFAMIDAHREAFAAFIPWIAGIPDAAAMHAWLASRPAGDAGFTLGLWRDDDRELVGWIRTKKLDRANEKGEIAFALAPPHIGHGYMTLAIDSLLDRWLAPTAAGGFGLYRCTVRSSTRHPRVRPLLSRLGFRHEGVIRETTIIQGERHDDDLWGLLAPERPSDRPAPPAPS